MPDTSVAHFDFDLFSSMSIVLPPRCPSFVGFDAPARAEQTSTEFGVRPLELTRSKIVYCWGGFQRKRDRQSKNHPGGDCKTSALQFGGYNNREN